MIIIKILIYRGSNPYYLTISNSDRFFHQKNKNRAELAYSFSIFLNKKSLNVLRLILLLVNLSPRLAEITSILMYII